MEKIWFFDTTLRDGEQAPGAAMSISEKIKIAHTLELMNVDIIEAGFPVSSPAQFEAVKEISNEIKNSIIAGLARTHEKDIITCYNALEDANKSRIHTFIATSPIHMEYKLKMKPAQVLEEAVRAVKLAKSLAHQVEFSAEDAARTQLNFLAEIVTAVIEAGADVVNIPDTVGYTVPEEFFKIIKYLKDHVKNINDAIISVHCHNDLGLAVSNSLSACLAGARQVETTINGIGERAGNAAMEEVVMSLKTRKDFYQLYTDIDSSKIYSTSKLVSRIIGYNIQPNKAIVGKNAFAHEAGIHQDGILKNRETYEIMTPASIGRTKGDLILGRHSGKAGFKAKIQELGFDVNEEDLKDLYQRFLNVADKRKEVTDEDVIALLGETGKSRQGYEIEYMTVVSGEKVIPTATIKLKNKNNTLEKAAIGDGPVDAAYNAINEALSITDVSVEDFHIQSISSGRDALGQVTVHINLHSTPYTGVAMDTDIILASAKAYVNALNKFFAKQGRSQSNEIIKEKI